MPTADRQAERQGSTNARGLMQAPPLPPRLAALCRRLAYGRPRCAALLCAVSLAGCGAGPDQLDSAGPVAVFERSLREMASGDTEAACALFTARFREQLAPASSGRGCPEAMAAGMSPMPDDQRAAVAKIRVGRATVRKNTAEIADSDIVFPAELDAAWRNVDELPTRLVRHGGRWLVDGDGK
ncbi:hypothetical protein [Paraconexibacter sp. AEG42_29]|uniref:hypothetical protein n=1 Tax=Paraconexibacter sp. AEG42_29 TaxID=2997339 RepID=UPI00339D3CBC